MDLRHENTRVEQRREERNPARGTGAFRAVGARGGDELEQGQESAIPRKVNRMPSQCRSPPRRRFINFVPTPGRLRS